MFPLTFGRYAQVGHDHQHGVRLHPQDVGRYVLVIQGFGCEDDARLVVHVEMTWKPNAKKEQELAERMGLFRTIKPLFFTSADCFNQKINGLALIAILAPHSSPSVFKCHPAAPRII